MNGIGTTPVFRPTRQSVIRGSLSVLSIGLISANLIGFALFSVTAVAHWICFA